jgi:hypothetical protein
MKRFPSYLKPDNKKKFSSIYFNTMKSDLRKDICLHVLNQPENNYFSLDAFYSKLPKDDKGLTCVQEIIEELKNSGWSCKLSYGDTGLFIYSTDNPPANCW